MTVAAEVTSSHITHLIDTEAHCSLLNTCITGVHVVQLIFKMIAGKQPTQRTFVHSGLLRVKPQQHKRESQVKLEMLVS